MLFMLSILLTRRDFRSLSKYSVGVVWLGLGGGWGKWSGLVCIFRVFGVGFVGRLGLY